MLGTITSEFGLADFELSWQLRLGAGKAGVAWRKF
jgi:hypothetical protein